MKSFYEPEINVVNISVEDVISTSGGDASTGGIVPGQGGGGL